MANSFLNIKGMGRKTLAALNNNNVALPRNNVGPRPKLSGGFDSEIALQDTRLSGVNKKLLRNYGNPARLLPRARGLKSLALGK